MKYLLVVRDSFAAAHRLVGSGGRCENLHGHNWKVEVTVETDTLDEAGMGLDFTVLKKKTAEVVGVSVPTVRRDWRMAQAWLKREMSG